MFVFHIHISLKLRRVLFLHLCTSPFGETTKCNIKKMKEQPIIYENVCKTRHTSCNPEIGKVRCVRSLLWPNHAIECPKASFNNLQNHLYHTDVLRWLFETKFLSRVLLGIFSYANSIMNGCFLFI